VKEPRVELYERIVRHEALVVRVALKEPTFGLSQQADEAGGSLILETQGRVASSPDKAGRGRYCQTTRCPVGKAGRCNASEPVVEPPQAIPRLQPGEYGPVSSARPRRGWRGRLRRVGLIWPAGRPRGRSAAYPWRGCRGRAGQRTRRPEHSERGNRPRTPSPAVSQTVEGQARRRLLTVGWDGAWVVVRGRESRSHGEARQRIRSRSAGRPGGRR